MSDRPVEPDEVARTAFGALEGERWTEFVGWVDPHSVERFRAEQVRWWKEAAEVRPPTPEQLRRMKPDMPEEVLEYQLRQWKTDRATRHTIATAFSGVQSLDELVDLSGAELLSRHLSTFSPLAKLAAVLDRLTDDAGTGDIDPREVLPRRQVLGYVRDGGSTAHVVYRLRPTAPDDPDDAFPPSIATLRLTGAGWRLLLDDDYFGLRGWTVLVDEP